jgi:hypothetical protein
LESHRLPVLDISLKDIPARWWASHKEKIQNWYQGKILLHIIFGVEQEKKYMEKYDGLGQPREHIDKCIIQWILVPLEEWRHHFIHTLEGILESWYMELVLHKGTTNWEELGQNFVISFLFEHENPMVDTTLKLVKERIFEEPEVEIVISY